MCKGVLRQYVCSTLNHVVQQTALQDEYFGPASRDRKLVGKLDVRNVSERNKTSTVFLLNDTILLAQRRSLHRQNVNSWIGKTHKTYKNQIHHGLDRVTVSDPELWTDEQRAETPMEHQEHLIHIGVLRNTKAEEEHPSDARFRTLRKGAAVDSTSSLSGSKFVLSLFVQAPSRADKTEFLRVARDTILQHAGELPEIMQMNVQRARPPPEFDGDAAQNASPYNFRARSATIGAVPRPSTFAAPKVRLLSLSTRGLGPRTRCSERAGHSSSALFSPNVAGPLAAEEV